MTNKIRIYYLEDDKDDQIFFKKKFRKDFDLFCENPKKDYKQLIDNAIANYDILITDYRLNELTGITYTAKDIINYINKNYQGFPCYVLTSYKDKDDIIESFLNPEISISKVDILSPEDNDRTDVFKKYIKQKVNSYKIYIKSLEDELETLVKKYKQTHKLTDGEINRAKNLHQELTYRGRDTTEFSGILQFNAIDELIEIKNALLKLYRGNNA